MTAVTSPPEIRYCVGGPLHGTGLSPFGDSAGLLYRLSTDFTGEPGRQAVYERMELTRESDGEKRDFLVLVSVTTPDGKLDADHPGLSHDEALAKTMAMPDHFWKPEA